MASSNLPQGSMGDPARHDNQARHGDQAKHGNLASHGEPFFSVAEALHLQQSVIGEAQTAFVLQFLSSAGNHQKNQRNTICCLLFVEAQRVLMKEQ